MRAYNQPLPTANATKASLKAKIKALTKQISVHEKALETIEAIESGDLPSADQAKRIKSQPYSFGVHFERSKVLRKVRSPGGINRSLRRFGTQKEAVQHGKRFTKIHHHKGFTIVRVSKRANAWINWRTGKTNPVLV